MRLSRALAAALATLAPIAACTTFGTDSAGPPDGGGDATTSTDGPSGSDAPLVDAAPPPCPDATCGTVVATNQAMVTEIDVDKGLVAWTVAGQQGAVRTAPRAGNVPFRNLAQPEIDPVGLQFFGADLIYFATGAAIHAVDRGDGGLTQALPSSIQKVHSQRRLTNKLAFTNGTNAWLCDVPGGAACLVPGTSVTLDGPGRGLQTSTAETPVWLYTPKSIYGLTTMPMLATSLQWAVQDTTLLLADLDRVYFAKAGSNAIYANAVNAKNADAATLLVTTAAPPTGLAMSPDVLYYSVADEGIVAKVAKTGGAPTVIAGGLPSPTAIASQDKLLFVVLGDGRIVSVPTSAP